MQLIKMSYKGFIFSVNPSSMRIKLEKSVIKKAIPFANSKSKELSFCPTVISGSGSFCGENARDEAHQLMKRFHQKGSSYLFVPDTPPLKAYFSKLNICYSATKDRIDYEFEFVEDCSTKSAEMNFGYTIAQKGENLYDIANRSGISVESLYSFNAYADMFSVSEGDKVWLC